jgi:hypothetical protein
VGERNAGDPPPSLPVRRESPAALALSSAGSSHGTVSAPSEKNGISVSTSSHAGVHRRFAKLAALAANEGKSDDPPNRPKRSHSAASKVLRRSRRSMQSRSQS